MSWFPSFQSELESVIGAVCPQVEGRIYTSVQTARQNLLQALTDGKLELPCAVVQMGTAKRDDAHGIHNRSFRVPTTILLLSQVSPDNYATDALTSLDALQVAIERSPHETFQAIEDGETDGQETNAALSALNDARMNLHAALLVYQPGLLTGDYVI